MCGPERSRGSDCSLLKTFSLLGSDIHRRHCINVRDVHISSTKLPPHTPLPYHHMVGQGRSVSVSDVLLYSTVPIFATEIIKAVKSMWVWHVFSRRSEVSLSHKRQKHYLISPPPPPPSLINWNVSVNAAKWLKATTVLRVQTPQGTEAAPPWRPAVGQELETEAGRRPDLFCSAIGKALWFSRAVRMV